MKNQKKALLKNKRIQGALPGLESDFDNRIEHNRLYYNLQKIEQWYEKYYF